MFKIEIKIKESEIKKYGEDLIKAIDLGLNDLADYIATKSDAILRGEELGGSQKSKHPGSFDTGMLAKSLTVNKEKEFEKVVAYEAPHSVYIEFGTAPHWTPIKPKYEWVMRQRSVLGVNPHTKIEARSPRMKAIMPTYYKEVMAPTMGIINKIHEEGSEAKPFLRPAVNRGKIEAKSIIKKQIEKLEG